MLDLKRLNDTPTKAITIRGHEVVVRSLSIAEQYAIERQAEPPVVRGRTPEEREVHRAHPDFVEKSSRADLLQFLLAAGASASIVDDSGRAWSVDLTPQTAAAYADSIMRILTRAEVAAISEARESLSKFSLASIGSGTEPGNSSAPLPTAAGGDGSSRSGTESPSGTSSSGSASASG